VVGQALSRELEQMQASRGVASKYRITPQPVVAAHGAKLKPSGTLRALFGVFAVGAILLFFVVSILDALAAMRSADASDRGDDVVGFNPTPEPLIPGMHDLRPAARSREDFGSHSEWRSRVRR
jgi:hypothetical protein